MAEAAKMAAEDCSPSSDLRGSEEYKRDMVEILTQRMIAKAISRANG
jgi:carbon-monoxide dehydrogenase medium subunit